MFNRGTFAQSWTFLCILASWVLSGCAIQLIVVDESTTAAQVELTPDSAVLAASHAIEGVRDTYRLSVGRSEHPAVLLTSGRHAGKVLVVGGYAALGNTDSAELWDPAGNGGAGSFTDAGTMTASRAYHTATLLTSGRHAGKVLVVGGSNGAWLSSAELWDPDGNGGQGSFTATGSLAQARGSHTATLLTSGTHAGKVLIIGGYSPYRATAELWDPDGNSGVGSFSAAGTLAAARAFHTATLISSGTHAGKVLAVGGRDGGGNLATAELWDPDGNSGAGSFTATGSLITARREHSATLLASGTHAGKVLIVGGMPGPMASAELWDPDGNLGAGQFSATGSLTTARNKHAATLIASGTNAGKVLISGGGGPLGSYLSSTEIWDPDGNVGAGSFSAGAAMTTARSGHSATLLTSGSNAGKILVIGGFSGFLPTAAELWDPEGNAGAGSASVTGTLATVRYSHTATLLTSGTHAGKVLLVGGINNADREASAELWDPSGNAGMGSFTATGSLTTGRSHHTATLLTSGTHAGKVLIIGGINGATSTASAELWDPDGNGGTGSFSATGSLITGRREHAAVLLTVGPHAGKVLVVGGYAAGAYATNAELWDPDGNAGAGSFTAAGAIGTQRANLTAVHLISGTHAGKVLVVGGDIGIMFGDAHSSAELWDPAGNAGAGSFSATGALATARTFSSATLLTSGTHAGKVLIVGGGDGGAYADAELWDPDGNAGAGSFSSTGSLATPRFNHTATLLASGPHAGKVLVAGGEDNGIYYDSVELWDPDGNAGAGSFTALATTLPSGVRDHSASLLEDGRVFFFGGYADMVAFSDYALYSAHATQPLSATGGSAPYAASILSGSGTLYWTGSSGLFVPEVAGFATIRVEDSLGSYDESLIEAQ